MSAQLRLSFYAALATMATSTALLSEFLGKAWVVPVMGAIILVSASCAAVRASPLPSAFEPITAALAVLLWITGLEVPSHAHLGFIPGRTAFRHLGRLARHGLNDVHHQPTPAPTHHGLVMLTVIAIAAVTLVVDLLVVTLRRAALAGLPLLGLFTVCAATGHHGVSAGPFILASAGYLWLLYADNREKVARWGAAVGSGSKARPASAWSTDPSSAPPPASLGRRVGATAISVGVVVPFLIPGLHTGIDRHTTHNGGGNGNGDTVQVANPIVSVAAALSSPSDTPLFRYTSTSPHPGYLRMTALDQFDGSVFSGATLSEGDKNEASENLHVSAPSGTKVTTDLTFLPGSSNFELSYLPAPTVLLGTSVGPAWRYDARTATVYSASTTTKPDMTYSTESVANDPTPDELADAGQPGSDLASDLVVPSSIDPKVYTLTQRITAKATTDYQAALDIQRYFLNGSFTYSTSIKADTGPDPLGDFLFKTKTGFCQQYATAMTAMARLDGIPARVAVGFTPGTKRGNTYTVTSHDAHAWPELWFQGYGWLAFEPTPRGDGQATPPSYAAANAGATQSGGHAPKPSASPSTSSSPFTGQGRPKPSGGSAGSGSGASGGHHSHGSAGGYTAWLIALVVILGVAVVFGPGTARSLTRRRRWRTMHHDPAQAATAAWLEIRDTTLDLGGAWDDGRSPRQLAAGLLAVVGPATDARASVRRLVRLEEESRYSAVATPVTADLRQDVSLLRGAIAASRSSRQRLRAVILPRSTVLVLRARLSFVDRVVGRIEHASDHARRRVRTRAKTQPAGGS